MKKYCKNPDCRHAVDENFKGKCPKCNSEGWKITRYIVEPPINVSDSVNAELKKIDPEALSKSLKLLTQKQEEIKKALVPFSKIQTSEMMKQILQMQKTLSTINLDKIKIPKLSFNIEDVLPKDIGETKTKEINVDAILTKAAENNPELKTAVESKNEIETADKTLNDVSTQIESLQKTTERNFKDSGDKQDEYHTVQMAEHQKTRDELLIDNGKLQEQIDTLKKKVNDGWKDPKNWSVGFIISVIAGILIWTVQYFS